MSIIVSDEIVIKRVMHGDDNPDFSRSMRLIIEKDHSFLNHSDIKQALDSWFAEKGDIHCHGKIFDFYKIVNCGPRESKSLKIFTRDINEWKNCIVTKTKWMPLPESDTYIMDFLVFFISTQIDNRGTPSEKRRFSVCDAFLCRNDSDGKKIITSGRVNLEPGIEEEEDWIRFSDEASGSLTKKAF